MNITSNRLFALCCALALAFACSAAAGPTDLDTSFDLDGERENPFPSFDWSDSELRFSAMALDHQERALIIGKEKHFTASSGLTYRALVGRVLAHGGSDPAYGTYGLTSIHSSLANDMVARALMALPDGSAFVCGDVQFRSGGLHGFVVRLDPQGSTDTRWAMGSGDSVALIGMPNQISSRCLSVELLGDGRVVVAGSTTRQGPVSTYRRPLVMMFDAQGYPDASFGDDGRVVIEVTGAPSAPTHALRVLEQPGAGLLVTVGAASFDEMDGEFTSGRHAYVVRLNLQGQIDPSFNIADLGTVSTDTFSTDGVNESDALAVLPDHSFQTAVPSFSRIRDHDEILVVREPRDSRIVGTAGEIWSKVLHLPDDNDYLRPAGMVVAPDGKAIVLGIKGRGGCYSDARLYMARLLDGGTLDPAFGSAGQHFWMPGATFDNLCMSGVQHGEEVALMRDGRILTLSTISPQYGTGDRPLLNRFMGSPFGTPPKDIEPGAISFAPKSTRANDMAESDWVQVAGIAFDVHVPAYVLGGEQRIGFGRWQSTPMWVKNGDWVQVRARAPATAGASATATLFVGGIRGQSSWASLGPRVSADFVVTSAAQALAGQRCSDNVFANGCSQAIPDNGNAITSELPLDYALSGDCNYISRVRVGLDIDHPYLGDLKITLLDPNYNPFGGGGNVVLLDRVRNGEAGPSGSCTADGMLGNVGDDATASADAACAATGGSGDVIGWVRPSQPLTALAGRRGTDAGGTSTVGTWTLVVRDLASSDAGQLNNWSIALECSDTAPSDELFKNSFE